MSGPSLIEHVCDAVSAGRASNAGLERQLGGQAELLPPRSEPTREAAGGI
jgi:hypothetical protein